VAPIPSPYPTGCPLPAGDPRSYCSCAVGCNSNYPPPDRWVVNVQPTTRHPWSEFVGRSLLRSKNRASSTCDWESRVGSHPWPFENIRLFKDLQAPGNFLRWKLRFQNLKFCLTIDSFLIDAFNDCCTDLHWDVSSTWFSTLCAIGPGVDPDIDVWPVRFDFEEEDI